MVELQGTYPLRHSCTSKVEVSAVKYTVYSLSLIPDPDHLFKVENTFLWLNVSKGEKGMMLQFQKNRDIGYANKGNF